MQHGWQIKRLHKMIMMSTAYRQSSHQPAEDVQSKAEQIDEGNDLLWRMNLRRTDAEVVRDSVLAIERQAGSHAIRSAGGIWSRRRTAW